MSRTVQTVVTYKDDLGSAGAATPVQFSIEGEAFEIHLNKRNLETFMRRVGVYTAVAHQPGPLPEVRIGKNGEVNPTSQRAKNLKAVAIREWARSQGITVSERGRIALDVVAAYDKSH